MKENLNKLTSRYEQVLNQAKAHALFWHKKEIEVVDLFWALIFIKGSVAKEVLNKSGLKLTQQQSEFSIESIKRPGSHLLERDESQIFFSSSVKRVIEKSVGLAAELEHSYVGTEHLLFALIETAPQQINKLLSQRGIDKRKLLAQLKIVFQATLNFSQMSNVIHQVSKMAALGQINPDELLKEIEGVDHDESMPNKIRFSQDEDQLQPEAAPRSLGSLRAKRIKAKRTSILDYFARDLTNEQNQKTIDPVIGRGQEIQRIIQILSRRTKNNPVLLGEPGVGKTAIVEGLAKRIIKGDVPDVLLNKKIYALDINMLVAGTIMRGEFEARLKQVIDEVKSNTEIILFIDELHNVIGAGSVAGTLDAANILKPALARGELRCIGATTFNEFKKHVEEDSALERRFQAVQIPEPSIEETIQIIQGIKENYEKHHLVKITPEAIESAASLSHRYLPEKFLPDKAIDLIDEAAASIKVNSGVVDEDLRQLKFLEAKIEEINGQKQEQVRRENYPQALKLKEQEMKLYDELAVLEDKILIKEDKGRWLGKITAKDVAQVVNQMTGLPIDNLISTFKTKLIQVDKKLGQRIIGQTEILKELSFYLKRAKAGLAAQNRPLGSFMFLGPSGVGKTETAKVLAQEIFSQANKKGSLIRLDMSEFAESFNISRLIGSPAGYVGFKEGGRLTEAVRHNPYSLILFDEIEKAHAEVFNILLQILDDGTLSDATGRKVDFRNTVVILTSNLGTKSFNQSDIGFGEESRGVSRPRGRDRLEKEIKEKFNPEFLNRLDKILVFKPLDLKSVEKIVELQLREVASNLDKRKIKLSWSSELLKQLAKLSYSPESGARNVKRVVEEKVENELADKILAHEIKAGQEVSLKWKEGKVNF